MMAEGARGVARSKREHELSAEHAPCKASERTSFSIQSKRRKEERPSEKVLRERAEQAHEGRASKTEISSKRAKQERPSRDLQLTAQQCATATVPRVSAKARESRAKTLQ